MNSGDVSLVEAEAMPRTGRILVDGGTYHVLTRGNNGQLVFHVEYDFTRYLEALAACAKKHNLTIYHFALLPASVHLVFQVVRGETVSRAMQSLSLSYALYYRKRYRYTGHLWQGRFQSLLIDRERDLLVYGRLVELNPLLVGLAGHPKDYPWTSYHAYVDGAAHALVAVAQHPLYAGLGSSAPERQERYRQFIQEGLRFGRPHIEPPPIPLTSWKPTTPTAHRAEWLGLPTSTRPRGRPRKLFQTAAERSPAPLVDERTCRREPQ